MNLHEQFTSAAQLINNSKNILLIPHAKMDCDGMSAALGLYLFLKKIGKNATAVCADPVPETLSFLPSTNIFSPHIPHSSSGDTHKYFVTIDTSNKGFKDLSYDVKDGKINLVLFSEHSPFEEKDFSFISSDFHPDLIITVDSGDTAQLGKIYTDNLDLFESVPVINIDHHVSNTHFGDVNLVNMKSCSTTEIVFDMLPYLHQEGAELVDEDIATLLLAGMLTDTGSFQHANTTPKSLDTAAILIEKGARHQQIIKHLFKTKSLAKLRLWGRLLTKMENDPIHRIIWSSVATSDLQETESHSDDSEGLIDELLATTPGTEMVLLIKEREDNIISTSIRSSSPLVDSIEFAQQFGGGGHKQAAGFKIRERGGKSFEEIVADIIFEAKNFQASRLHLPVPKRQISDLIAKDAQNKSAQEENKTQNSISDKAEKIQIHSSSQQSESLVPPLPENIISQDISTHIPNADTQNNENILTDSAQIEAPDIDNSSSAKNIENSSEPFIPEDIFENPDNNDFEMLSPEEKPFLETKKYAISEPEKTINKDEIEQKMKENEQENEINDFADFLSQTDDGGESHIYEPAIETPKPVENIMNIDDLEHISSDLHKEDTFLASLQSPVTEKPVQNTQILENQDATNPPNQLAENQQYAQPQIQQDPFLASLEQNQQQPIVDPNYPPLNIPQQPQNFQNPEQYAQQYPPQQQMPQNPQGFIPPQ